MGEYLPPSRGSRKFAVSLFADLTGYTALCERLDPEDVERVVAPLMIGMQHAVETESGVVLNVAGDGLFAIFGVPDSLPDSPERAIRAALRMRSIAAEMNEGLEGLALPAVHIGIAAGEVLLTEVAQKGSWSVIGTSVNLASRLCDAAKAGEVLVEDTCRHLVDTGYSWEEPRQLSLKGQDRITVAWPLMAAASELMGSPRSIVFVGRSPHLAALDAELEAVASTGQSRIVVLRGVAGIGKSSLAQRWLSLHPELPSWIIECDESRRHDDLLALSEVLDNKTVDRTATHTTHTEPVDRSDPYPLVVHALRAGLRQATADTPRALLVENLHASDTILGEFLLDVSQAPLEAPLLVIATWRDESETRTEPALLGRTLHLSSLDDRETRSLIESLLGEAIDAATVARVRSHTDGHPLLVRESALHLGAVKADAGDGSSLPPEALRDSLPASLRMFLAARIDRLSAGYRAVVHDLSALGAGFSADRVASVLGQQAASALPTLCRQGILVERGARWSFAHDLLRDVAYSTLTRAQRANLHRRQLDLLPPDADPYERADHALAWNEAVSPVDRSQHVASTIASVRESLGLARLLYERQSRAALSALRSATSAARDCVALEPSLSAQLWALEAQCLSELGLNDDALSLATLAERTAADAGLPALRLAPLMTRGYVLSTLRRFESARQSLDEAAQLAESLGDRSSQAEAVRLLADTWRHSLNSRFIALTEEAYHLFDSTHDKRGSGECARTLAYLTSAGSYARFNTWRSLAESLTTTEDLRGAATLAKADAIAKGGRFDYEGYQAAGSTLLEIGTALEAPDLMSEGLLNLADALVHLGQPKLACDASMRLVELATAQGDRRMRATAAAASVRPLLRIGELARSSEELRVSLEMAREFGRGEEAFVSGESAVCLADRGLWSDALQGLQDSIDAFVEDGYTLAALGRRVEQMRLAAVFNRTWSSAAVNQILTDAREIEAPLVASYVLVLDAWARAARGEEVPVPDTPKDACLEELALRADAVALQQELRGEDARASWQAARELWKRLGYTIWLARAQARSGDLEAARHTLDVLDSPAEARTWALGEAAGQA